MPAPPPVPARWLVSPGRWLELDQPRLMGILNVTPDSFSDGGELPSPEAAVERGLQHVDEGAAIIDVGGESTRPGAAPVDAGEQIRRVVPVIAALAGRTAAIISVDTTRAAVAEAALDAGAAIINDVSAGRDDPAMLPLAARRGCGLVLMHRLRAPGDDAYSDRYREPPHYDDVVADVARFLAERIAAAEAAGVDRAAIVVDPGFGFGKSVDQNYQLIAGTAQLQRLGCPLLSAASRKSFIGAVAGVSEPRRRDAGSIAVSIAHWMAGVHLFRVHDVAAHRQALAVAAAIGAAAAGAHPSGAAAAGAVRFTRNPS